MGRRTRKVMRHRKVGGVRLSKRVKVKMDGGGELFDTEDIDYNALKLETDTKINWMGMPEFPIPKCNIM